MPTFLPVLLEGKVYGYEIFVFTNKHLETKVLPLSHLEPGLAGFEN